MLDWDDLKVFVELARRGSLSETARQLKADHSTVARRIAALEAALGAKLFDRLPRGYLLTAEGARLVERAGQVEAAVLAVERLAGSGRAVVTGRVRISAPPAFASHWLVPRLAPLRQRYPGLCLEILGETAAASLVRREADIALRLSRPAGGALVARKLGWLRYGLYGARDYVAATPESAWEFLGYHEELASAPQQRWIDEVAAGRPFALRSNDLVSLISGVRAGLGLAALPHILVQEDASLACVGQAPTARRDLWFLVHPDLRRAARIRAVLDHLVAITEPLRG